jgi:hypothetical protein
VPHTTCAGLAGELSAINSRLHLLVETSTPEAFVRRPATGGWSPAECIEHLSLTSEAMLPRIRAALGTAPGGAGPFKTGLLAGLLVWYLEPPYRQGARTPPPFVPEGVHDRESVLLRFGSLQADLAALLDQAEGKALDRVRIASPFAENLKYNLFAAFRILLAHQRRHLFQAERALRA